jgi:signal transduction histidine kinase/ActR/RegA family two-component response regulator
VTGYLIAVGATLLALLVTSLIWPILEGGPFIIFFSAVLVSAWYGGLGPGLLTIALTILLMAYFFAVPAHSLLVHDPAVIARLGVFGLAAGLVTLFSNSRRQALVDLQRIQQERLELLERERQARLEAEAANRAKDVFLATVSHELRNPLSAMLGWVQVLRRRSADRATTERALEIIERNAKLQDKLIEDLLDVSRIVSGKLRLDACPSDLLPVVEAAVDVVQPSAQAKSIRLLRMLDPAAGPVLADATRIQQVVWNLLSNAIKFTPQGGRVEVRLVRTDGHVELSVSDTGQGIAAEALPRLFEPFWQVDAGTSKRHGGLGLGLAITRKLVEMHGGEIRAASDGVGQGTTFTLTLPLIDTARQGSHRVVGAAAAERPMLLKDLSVLVVDAEPGICTLVRSILEEHGAQVTTAASASEALAALRSTAPHILIADLALPDTDGCTLIRKLRDSYQSAIPAVALTALARAEDSERILAAGFQVHISKPVQPVRLAAAVVNLTRRVAGKTDGVEPLSS